MSLDALIANPGRLRILTALVSQPRQEFVQLRHSTKMTDGNLATHARRLHLAGMVDIDKSFRAGKPVTTFTLTTQGRDALQSHLNQLMQAMTAPASIEPEIAAAPISTHDSTSDENWID